nr:hypothetical protein [Neobacillus sp. Marseille-Q6967]
MDAAAWLTISIVGFSLAGVLLITATFMFFKMNIPAIIGDLTGKTAARQIQEIREQNKLTGNKRHLPDALNVVRGPLTDSVDSIPVKPGIMSKSARLMAHPSKRLDLKGETESTSRGIEVESLPTEVLPSQDPQSDETTVLFFEKEKPASLEMQPNETEVLDSGTEVLNQGTEVLDSGTEVLYQGTEVLEAGTEVLDQGTEVLWQENGTTVLDDSVGEAQHEDESEIPKIEFKIVKDIKITHTSEKI